MASYNRVILVGNITRDIELKYTQGGTAVTEIGLAVNDRRKTANGDWVDETTFVRCHTLGSNRRSRQRVSGQRLTDLDRRTPETRYLGNRRTKTKQAEGCLRPYANAKR